MRPILKNLAVIIVIILIASSSSVVLLSEPRSADKPIIDRYDEYPEDIDDEYNETENGNGHSNGEKFPWDSTHFVFIEEATGKDCVPCLPIAKKLYELYKSGKYPFYYISLIMEHEETAEYVNRQYNYYAYPSVYIDGGYKTIFGGSEESVANIEKYIKNSLNRDFSSVYINVSAEWDENKSEISIKGKIKNDGNSVYKGKLRIFLAEIITIDWVDASKKPFHFGANSIIADDDIEIPSKDLKNFSKTIESTYPDPENLIIFAAIYNSKSVKRDSDPNNMDKTGDHEFDAHFADNVAATELVEGGNLPPFVGISLPESGLLHISGKPIFKFILLLAKKTVMFGKIDIKVNVTDEEGIDRVEFFLDNESIFIDEEEPYEYTIDKIGSFRTLLPRKHNIKVVAWDKEEKYNSANIDVLTIFI
ncbi:MAG: hypothetical protein JSU91_00960 [Thermoplasmatales archaeon]|nr:MAG: hypothetical protein JSU91_00960 [Thermoplasmatales archaeon]